jgi:predicted amidohydrolase
LLNVGIAQINVLAGDREGNFRRVREWASEHCAEAPDFTAVVLPELWDVGYALKRKDELADEEGRESAAFLAGLARRYGVWFVGGSVLARSAGRFFNRAQIIDPSGKLLAHYDKAHLVPMFDEAEHLSPGNSRCLFEIGGAEAGCVVCYDLRFCEFIRRYALDGAKVLFLSAQWPSARIDHWSAMLRARAIENMMFVAACNSVGKSGGRSMVIDPSGAVLYQGPDDKEDSAFVTIDPSAADEARAFLKVFDMRRPELY